MGIGVLCAYHRSMMVKGDAFEGWLSLLSHSRAHAPGVHEDMRGRNKREGK